MSQTLKEAIAELPMRLTQVRGGKIDNRCYVTLNAAIHKVISELHKLDTKMPTPIEFVQQVTIQEQQYQPDITASELLQNETQRYAREYQLQINDNEPKQQQILQMAM
jgi:hypothetical protein